MKQQVTLCPPLRQKYFRNRRNFQTGFPPRVPQPKYVARINWHYLKTVKKYQVTVIHRLVGKEYGIENKETIQKIIVRRFVKFSYANSIKMPIIFHVRLFKNFICYSLFLLV